MGAAGIELEDFVTPERVERCYRRMLELRAKGEHDPKARALLVRGMNMARAKYGPMLLFLEKGANILQKMNDAQQIRLRQDGNDYAKTDFTEFATWREAYLLADDPAGDVKFRVLGWAYASVAEVLGA
jgi:hypothetical protein